MDDACFFYFFQFTTTRRRPKRLTSDRENPASYTCIPRASFSSHSLEVGLSRFPARLACVKETCFEYMTGCLWSCRKPLSLSLIQIKRREYNIHNSWAALQEINLSTCHTFLFSFRLFVSLCGSNTVVAAEISHGSPYQQHQRPGQGCSRRFV